MLSQVRIRIDAPGEPDLIEVNGQDLTQQVARITVDRYAARPAQIFLESFGPTLIDGVADVVQRGTAGSGQVIAEWLRSLNPEEMEAAVLESDFNTSVTAALLEHLASLAELEKGDG